MQWGSEEGETLWWDVLPDQTQLLEEDDPMTPPSEVEFKKKIKIKEFYPEEGDDLQTVFFDHFFPTLKGKKQCCHTEHLCVLLC